jgi:hypothetical protein
MTTTSTTTALYLQSTNLLALTFDGSTLLRVSDASTQTAVLDLTARADALVMTLRGDIFDRKITVSWHAPAPSTVNPKWVATDASNGYDIEFPEFATTSVEYSWTRAGMRYSVGVSQQAGKPGWLKVRKEGPQ